LFSASAAVGWPSFGAAGYALDATILSHNRGNFLLIGLFADARKERSGRLQFLPKVSPDRPEQRDSGR
jgi:hypothetical protein